MLTTLNRNSNNSNKTAPDCSGAVFFCFWGIQNRDVFGVWLYAAWWILAGLADVRQQSLARGAQVFRLCQSLELKKARTGFLPKGIGLCSEPCFPNWSKHEHRVGVEVLWLSGRAMFPGLD